MGKRGPKKKPTEDLTSWRAKLSERQNEVKVEALPQPPECPEWITGRATYFWGQVAPAVFAAKLLSSVDVPALGTLCERLADAERFGQEAQGRELIECDSGTRINPLLKARDVAISDVRRFYVEFGMSPASRIGLPAVSQKAGAVVDSRSHFAKG